jgi:Tubulin-tyrosine ligase family
MPEEEVGKIWSRIKEITYMAFSSVKKKINQNQRKHCFEIFGLDFFIDSELKVWLIEVNENPCIECSSPLLGELIPRMLNDAFRLTIDQIIDKKIEEKSYPVKGYPDG